MSFFKIIRRPHFSPYKVYLRRDLQLVVCLNPKVGSTSFRNTLVDGLQTNGETPMLGPLWPISKTRRYTTAPLADFCHAFKHPDEYEWHCFVRNPYSRVLSAWNDKLVKGFHSEHYPRSMRKLVPQIRNFADEHGLEGATEDAPLPFSTFLSYIESQEEGQRNQHWDTQCSVLNVDPIQYTHIHRMEDGFAEATADLLERVGIDRSWSLQQLGTPSNASGKIAHPVYDDKLAYRVYKLFSRDFEVFGYDPDSWMGL